MPATTFVPVAPTGLTAPGPTVGRVPVLILPNISAVTVPTTGQIWPRGNR